MTVITLQPSRAAQPTGAVQGPKDGRFRIHRPEPEQILRSPGKAETAVSQQQFNLKERLQALLRKVEQM